MRVARALVVALALGTLAAPARSQDAKPAESDPARPVKFGITVGAARTLGKLSKTEQTMLGLTLAGKLDSQEAPVFFQEAAKMAGGAKGSTKFTPALTTTQALLWVLHEKEGEGFGSSRVSSVIVPKSGVAASGRVLKEGGRDNPFDPETQPKEFWKHYGIAISDLPGGLMIAHATPTPAPKAVPRAPAPCGSPLAPPH